MLDSALGFAGGVMIAASYWSLLAPAIEFAEQSGLYGDQGQWAFLPVSVGFLLGGAFVFGADRMLPKSAFDTVNHVQVGHPSPSLLGASFLVPLLPSNVAARRRSGHA